MGVREGNLQAPTRHPVDWRSPSFYAEAALERELERVFDIGAVVLLFVVGLIKRT